MKRLRSRASARISDAGNARQPLRGRALKDALQCLWKGRPLRGSRGGHACSALIRFGARGRPRHNNVKSWPPRRVDMGATEDLADDLFWSMVNVSDGGPGGFPRRRAGAPLQGGWRLNKLGRHDEGFGHLDEAVALARKNFKEAAGAARALAGSGAGQDRGDLRELKRAAALARDELRAASEVAHSQQGRGHALHAHGTERRSRTTGGR